MQMQLPPIFFRPILPAPPEPTVWLQPEALVAYATLALALVTLYLAIMTRRLAKDSAVASQTAQQSVALGQESMNRSLRAYVTVKEVNPDRQDRTQLPHGVEIIFVNTGQTPALSPLVFSCTAVTEPWPHKSFDPESDQYQKTWRASAGRDQIIRVWRDYNFSPAETEAIRTEQQRFAIYGALRYSDAFCTEPRWTQFCYVWDVSGQVFVPTEAMHVVS